METEETTTTTINMAKIDFKNLPDTSTPLNAENLNAIQDNTEKAIQKVQDNVDTIQKKIDELPEDVGGSITIKRWEGVQ